MKRAGRIKPGEPKRYFVGHEDDEYEIEIHGLMLQLRPKGSRKADAVVSCTPAQLYRHLMLARVEEAKRAKPRRRRTVRRGLLNP